jgi:hypothetical protein
MHDLHFHIEHEKNEDMPRLEKILSKEELESIVKLFIRTKQIVPTKSHPDAPTSHWAIEGLAGLLVAPIDKLRTMMESFPKEETGSSEVDLRRLV